MILYYSIFNLYKVGTTGLYIVNDNKRKILPNLDKIGNRGKQFVV